MKFSTTSIVIGLVAFAASTNAADGDSCSTEGQITCNSDNTWSVCGSGLVQNMGQVAAGMACVGGNMVAKSSVTGQDTDSVATTALAEAMLLETFLQLVAGQLDKNQEQLLIKAAEFELSYVPASQVPSNALPNGTAPDTSAPVSSFIAAPITSTVLPTPIPTPSTTPAPLQNSTGPLPVEIPDGPSTVTLATLSPSNVAARSYPIHFNSLPKRGNIVCVSIKIGNTKQYICI